jgi:septum formation protein
LTHSSQQQSHPPPGTQPEPGQAQLILASASPRRHELLRQVGISYIVVVSDADESFIAGETPADYVDRVARLKAEAVAGLDQTGLPILAADTAVVIDNEIMGKPGSTAEAEAMLRRLGGRVHEVYSAVVLIDSRRRLSSRLSVTRVRFADLREDWIAAYCASGEPMDKAGAYGVQGCAAHRIRDISGSYSGVMGLPLFETVELLSAAGLALPPLHRIPGEVSL